MPAKKKATGKKTAKKKAPAKKKVSKKSPTSKSAKKAPAKKKIATRKSAAKKVAKKKSPPKTEKKTAASKMTAKRPVEKPEPVLIPQQAKPEPAPVKKIKKPKQGIKCDHCAGTGVCAAGLPYDKSHGQMFGAKMRITSCPECLAEAGEHANSKKLVDCRICDGDGEV